MKKERKEMTHNEKISYYREMKNSALSFFIISAITFVVGVIFIFLSFKYNILREKVFVISIEFFVAIIALVAAISFLTLGIIYYLKSRKNLKAISKEGKTE